MLRFSYAKIVEYITDESSKANKVGTDAVIRETSYVVGTGDLCACLLGGVADYRLSARKKAKAAVPILASSGPTPIVFYWQGTIGSRQSLGLRTI